MHRYPIRPRAKAPAPAARPGTPNRRSPDLQYRFAPSSVNRSPFAHRARRHATARRAARRAAQEILVHRSRTVSFVPFGPVSEVRFYLSREERREQEAASAAYNHFKYWAFQIPGRSGFRVTRAPQVRRLERISKRELHAAIVDRGRKHLPLGRIADDVIRCSEVRMVEGVERIRAELKLLPLGDAECFG